MKKLIPPKNLKKWFDKLPKDEKLNIYKYWLNKENYYEVIKAPKFVDPIDYFKRPHLSETTNSIR